MTHDSTDWHQRCEAILSRHQQADAGHDLHHARRVLQAARTIAAATDEPADELVITASALLHDLVAVPKDAPDRAQASQQAADRAVELLAAAGFPADRLAAVAHAIAAHSFSAGIPCASIEARIVQDADRLEALGAIGIARCFYTGGLLGSAIVDPADPLAEHRSLDDRAYALDHFAVKLLKLPATMQTTAGRHLAERRAAVVSAFRAQLIDELAGNDLL